MSRENTYLPAQSSWKGPKGIPSAKLTIQSRFGTKIARIPLYFLESCGDNTWGYVSYVVSLLIVPDRRHPGFIMDFATGRPVVEGAAPVAGCYDFFEEDKLADVTFAPGPVLPSLGQCNANEGGLGVVPPSSALQTLRHNFVETLLLRDPVCPVSGSRHIDCEATHIVPWYETEVYKKIDGHTEWIFTAKAGLLLDIRLHRQYNNLEWSLYYKENTFFVHFFNPPDKWRRGMNGKAIPLSAFRNCQHPPDPALTAWHYAQTIMARFRIFTPDYS